MKIDPKIKGKHQSNFGLTLINIIKLKKILSSKKNRGLENILYSNYKYNSFRAEKYLKEKKINKFKLEIKKILKYNKNNSRAHAIFSYALQKHNIKTIDNFCYNPLKNIKEYDLHDLKILDTNLISKINRILNKIPESASPGSVYEGDKSIGNLFDLKNEEISILKKIILKKINCYKNYFKNHRSEQFIKNFPKKYLLKGWSIKINRAGGIDSHIHNAWISGVLYTRVPENAKGGEIEFSLADWGFKKEKKFVKIIVPKNAKLILFPSSLPHAVKKFNDKNNRISIAFDLVPI